MLLPFIIQNLPAVGTPQPVAVEAFSLTTTVLDFGADLDFVDDIPLNDSLASGLKNLGNALARRLITPRGTLRYDLGYGTDVRQYLNEGVTRADVSAIVAAIQQELESDERVLRANVEKINLNEAASSLTVEIRIDTDEGPFTLVLAIGTVSAEVLKVST